MRAQDLMTAEPWQGQDLAGWIGCELLNGLRAFWDGRALWTSEGDSYRAPGWFTEGLPSFPLDCELFAGYGKRNLLTNIHTAEAERWRSLRLVIFDAPEVVGAYLERLAAAAARVRCDFGEVIITVKLNDTEDGWYCCREIVARGGEGLIAHHPSAPYRAGRELTVLKLAPGLNDNCSAAFAAKAQSGSEAGGFIEARA